jgi:uncharacterized membrane protein YfcA
MVELWAGLITLAATTVLTVAGVGAAFILIPLYLALGIGLHTAMSTALLLNGISMAFASVTFARQKLILWRLAWPILIAATMLAPLGAYGSQYVPRSTLLILFACFLLFAASMLLFYRAATGTPDAGPRGRRDGNPLILGLPVGGFAGFIGGLLGVGGGNVIVPALVWFGIPAKQASATTAFIVIFSSLAGFAGRVSLGSLDPALLATTVAGSIGGALLGAWAMARKLQNRHVKILIGVLLYLIAAKILFDLWH